MPGIRCCWVFSKTLTYTVVWAANHTNGSTVLFVLGMFAGSGACDSDVAWSSKDHLAFSTYCIY